MRRLTGTAALVLAALALVTAGCGGSEESAAGDTATVEETTGSTETTGTETDESTTTEETSTTEETETSGGIPTGDCAKLTELSAEYGKVAGAVSGAGDTAGIEASAKAFEEFADKAPEAVREDFKVIASAFAKYAEVLKDVDLTSGQPDPDVIAKIQALFTGDEAQKVQAASERINTWSNENCAP